MDFSLTDSERDLVELCRDFAQQGDRARAPAGVGGGPLRHRPAARDGRAGPARHADPRGVGRHRHVDGRLRRRAGADRAGGPVGGRRVAGARHDRFACRCCCSATTRSASAGCARSPRGGCSVRSASPSRRPGRTPAASAPGPSVSDGGWRDQRPARRSSPTPAPTCRSGSPCCARTAGRRRQGPAVRQLRRREGHPRLHDGPEDARASAGAAWTRASCTSTTSGCPDDQLVGDPDLGLEPVPRRRWRSAASRSPRCR